MKALYENYSLKNVYRQTQTYSDDYLIGLFNQLRKSPPGWVPNQVNPDTITDSTSNHHISTPQRLKIVPDLLPTRHKLIIGDSKMMSEVADNSVHLMVTSPPYYNAPHDYKGLFSSYDAYLELLECVANEAYRVLEPGRIAAINIDDMLVDGDKYPIVADTTTIFKKAGFRYRDCIQWKKPDGYIRASRRSGNLVKHLSPMYYYPDNILESIIIFQKGRFDYKSIDPAIKSRSSLDINEIQDGKWVLNFWEMKNVLPRSDLEKGIAAFPEELPYRLIKLYSHTGETVLDPFMGSGTTMKVAKLLARNSIGIEFNKSCLPVIRNKIGFADDYVDEAGNEFELVIR